MKSTPKTSTPIDQCAVDARIVELSQRVELYLTEYSVELLATKMAREEFIAPSYQRA